MSYIANRPGDKRSNAYRDLSYDDLKELHDKSMRDLEASRRVTEERRRGVSLLDGVGPSGSEFRRAVYDEILFRDPMTNGNTTPMPHGCVAMQGERSDFYRGERSMHKKSVPTLARALDQLTSPDDRLLYRLVAEMRIAEFDIFIHAFDRLKQWEDRDLTILTEPLAQHYGLETDWLDITNDFDTALFFATCRWDNGKKKWFPLTRDDTERPGKEQYRYGVIFHAPAGPSKVFSMGQYFTSGSDEGMVLPLGYQPFLRCQSQYGYAMHMTKPVPLQKNLTFEKLRFLHSEKLSREVYERMGKGKKVYPDEGLSAFFDVIDAIVSATEFSEEAFAAVLEKNGLAARGAELRAALEAFRPVIDKRIRGPFHIGGNTYLSQVPQERIREANQADADYSIEKANGIQPGTRPVFYTIGEEREHE